VQEGQSHFWNFSLTVYGDSAVQKECLVLQDRYDINVNMLLFCAFVGAVHGAVLSDRGVSEAADLVAEWNKNIVRKLREARRALKPFATDRSVIVSSSVALRMAVKAAELDAERIEQAMLEAWSAVRIDGWPRARPIEAVATNIRGLFARCDGSARPPEMPDHLITGALAVARRRDV
jgi:uncharacterized protein (TIGR02444 family)